MTGDRLGSLSLRVDAIYCLVMGLLVTVAAGPVASATRLSVPVVVVVGLVVVVWAAAVELMSRRLAQSLALRLVMVANVVAAVGIALSSAIFDGHLIALSVLTIAIDVALFAVSQAVALRRLRADRTHDTVLRNAA